MLMSPPFAGRSGGLLSVMKNKIQELYALEQLAGGSTCVHRLHPTVKVLAAAIFIAAVVSFDRYAMGRLIPYVFYPALLMALSETPHSMLLKRFLVALPFCLLAGISNVILDRAPALVIGGVTLSLGAVSFFTILFRTYLCVMAVLILVSTTPFAELTGAMRRLRMPHIFVTMFEMTYRYIGVLLEEAYSMYVAYTLRSAAAKGIAMRDMPVFAGHLLLRSFDRADRVYNAMKCRGYALRGMPLSDRKLTRADLAFLAVSGSLCAVLRLVNVNALFIRLL